MRLRLGQERLRPLEVLLAGREFFLVVRELPFSFVGSAFAVPDPLFAIEQFDRPSLKEFPLPRELRFLALHGLLDFLGDLARRSMRGDEPFLRHGREPLAQLCDARLNFASRLLLFRRAGGRLTPFSLQRRRRILNRLLELRVLRDCLAVLRLEVRLCGEERLLLLVELLTGIECGLRIRFRGLRSRGGRDRLGHLQCLDRTRYAFRHAVLHAARVVREVGESLLLPREFLLSALEVCRFGLQFRLQFGEGLLARAETGFALRDALVRFGPCLGRTGGRRARGRLSEMRVRGREQE